MPEPTSSYRGWALISQLLMITSTRQSRSEQVSFGGHIAAEIITKPWISDYDATAHSAASRPVIFGCNLRQDGSTSLSDHGVFKGCGWHTTTARDL